VVDLGSALLDIANELLLQLELSFVFDFQSFIVVRVKGLLDVLKLLKSFLPHLKGLLLVLNILDDVEDQSVDELQLSFFDLDWRDITQLKQLGLAINTDRVGELELAGEVLNLLLEKDERSGKLHDVPFLVDQVL
jgi:hypothetical protein